MRLTRLVLPFLPAVIPCAFAQTGRFSADDLPRIVRIADPQIAPDGRTVAIVVGRANLKEDRWDSELTFVDVETKTLRPMTHDRLGVGWVRWSPDGSRIAFLAQDGDKKTQVFVMPVSGGDALQLTHAKTAVRQLAWRPDGEVLAFAAPDEAPEKKDEAKFEDAFEVGNNSYLERTAAAPVHLWTVPARGGEAKRLTSGTWSLPVHAAPAGPPSEIAYLPDGKSIVFVTAASPITGESESSRLEIIDVATGAMHSLTFFLHQADWLAYLLHGQLGISDYHNSLKLGYDVERLCYPDWLDALPFRELLPRVVAPGTPIAEITPTIATQFDLPSTCLVCAGTTDSIAAFLASGVKNPGEAVTSLGSTLVLKLLSQTRVEDSRYGIYSHRLGNLWLVGGASNTGGAVLRHFFSDAELAEFSQQIPLDRASLLDYYPLLKPGDRFPINDPHLLPRLAPRPSDRVAFLHGLLESIARLEAEGYRLLQSFGASKLTQVYTAGGGATNESWAVIRERHLRVSVRRSSQTEAAYGTANLAMQSRDRVFR